MAEEIEDKKKKTPKRARRNFANELADLQGRVTLACDLISKAGTMANQEAAAALYSLAAETLRK